MRNVASVNLSKIPWAACTSAQWLLAQGQHGTVWQFKWGCFDQILELISQEGSCAIRSGKQQPQIVFSREQRLRQWMFLREVKRHGGNPNMSLAQFRSSFSVWKGPQNSRQALDYCFLGIAQGVLGLSAGSSRELCRQCIRLWREGGVIICNPLTKMHE